MESIRLLQFPSQVPLALKSWKHLQRGGEEGGGGSGSEVLFWEELSERAQIWNALWGQWENMKGAYGMVLNFHHILPYRGLITWLPRSVLTGARGQRNRKSPCLGGCHSAAGVPNEWLSLSFSVSPTSSTMPALSWELTICWTISCLALKCMTVHMYLPDCLLRNASLRALALPFLSVSPTPSTMPGSSRAKPMTGEQIKEWMGGERECVQEVEKSLGALLASEGSGVDCTCGMRYSACTTLVVSTVICVLSWQFAMHLPQLFPVLLQLYLHTYFPLRHGWCHTHHSRNCFQT